MTAVTPQQSRPPLVAGGQVSALIPQSLDEAFRVANAIAASGLAPKGVEKPEQVLVAIMAGAELGFAPFQAMQSFAVINGKPNIWGDALPALLWSRGFDIDEWFDDADAPTKAFCKITRPGGKEVERSFSLTQAKAAGLLSKQGPWQQYQSRMLQMRARAFAARDGASDVLRGMQIAEEVQDYTNVRDVTPRQGPGLSARLAAPTAPSEGFTAVHTETDAATPPEAASAPALDEGAGDLSPDAPQADGAGDATELAEPNGDDETGSAADLLAWADNLKADVDGLSLEQIEAILGNPNDQPNFAELERTQPQVALDLNRAIGRRKRELA